jgi:putative membrane-bound dehydrogenase-like protein
MAIGIRALAFLLAALPAVQETVDGGIKPVGADGRELNLDFETGTLDSWTAEGKAFEGQPVEGDLVAARRTDMRSRHQGRYWIGTYERGGDVATGTLTSAPFKLTQPFASFLIGGGSHENTGVEIRTADGGTPIAKVSGEDSETMRPVILDLTPHVGKQVFIRVLDGHSGGWGHVNFDCFRLWAARPALQEARGGAAPPTAVVKDSFKHAGLAPEEAAKAMSVPDGFRVMLGAGEPDVTQPIAMALDERGRVWVAECPDYPVWKPSEQGGKSRVVIFEDEDGDGRLEKRTVFIEGLNFISGLELGFGGVWIGAPPHLLFVPDRDGDDVPDGAPVPVLDGWGHQDTHETLNAFIWGPDGWLYGCHGVFTHSNVGKPGSPPEQRQRINAGYWRYHPRKDRFEVFAHGCSNQWGIDFDDHGQAFATACVIPHLFHVVQGGRYQRQAGQHFNPYTYDDLKTIADHRHYTGPKGPHSGNGQSDAAGGGHAHCGAMVYLGDNFPPEYRNRIFFNNIHGARINMDILEPRGSGFVGRHGTDFLLANDSWSQILNLRYGPDGGAWIIDWYDRQQCHTNRENDHDRSNGRIFKVLYGNPTPLRTDLRKLSTGDLVKLMLHRNDWFVRHARKVLQERGAKDAAPALQELLAHPDPARVLRAMWALHAIGAFTPEWALRMSAHASAHVRGWSLQLAYEDGPAGDAMAARLKELAAGDPSPVVRLYVASALQRLPVEARGGILESLLSHAEDAEDPNLPLMYWYALEPVVGADARQGALLLGKNKIPALRAFISRRMVAGK